MAKRGRKPAKPKAVRRAAVPKGDPHGWSPPGHLTVESVVAWRHLVALLVASGNLEKTDPTIVEAYAINVAMLRQAQACLASDGVIVRNSRGTTFPNPAAAVVNSATMRIKAIVNDLGLCPASSKYAGTPDAPKSDKWGGLLDVVG